MLTDTGVDLWQMDGETGEMLDPVIHVVQRVNAAGDFDRLYWNGITDDGRTVMLADTDGLRRFDAATGQQIGEQMDARVSVPLQAGGCACRPFAVTDRYLITAEAGIVVRDLDDLSVVARMSGAGSSPVQFRVSADDRVLQVVAVNTANDASVALYDLESFARIGEPVHLAGLNPHAAISADGVQMVLASDAGITVWDIDPDHWATAACTLAGRNLTPAEWTTFLSWAGAYHETCPPA
jgi:hypothetical protein